MRERQAVVVVEIGGVAWSVLQKLGQFRPALLVNELFGLG